MQSFTPLFTLLLILFMTTPSLAGSVTSLLQAPPESRPSSQHQEEKNSKSVIAEGFAVVRGGNVEKARQAALRMAYSEAVSQVVGMEIGSLSLIRNAKFISDVVMSRSRGFLKSYAILREGLSEDGNQYEVVIKAVVLSQGVEQPDTVQGLQLYLGILGNPKILLLLPEEHISLPAPSPAADTSCSSQKEISVQSDGTTISIRNSDNQSSNTPTHAATGPPSFDGTRMRSTEAALAQAFSKYGYEVLTSDDLAAQGVSPQKLHQARQGVTTAAVEVARFAGADLAIVGVLRLNQRGVSALNIAMSSVTAEVSAKAIIVSSGKTIHAFHQTERSSAPDQLTAYSSCLDKVATQVAEVLSWKIPKILTEEQRIFSITVANVGVAETAHLRTGLTQIDGVESVRILRIPTASQKQVHLNLITGFILPDTLTIVDHCERVLHQKISIEKSNKYELMLRTGTNI